MELAWANVDQSNLIDECREQCFEASRQVRPLQLVGALQQFLCSWSEPCSSSFSHNVLSHSVLKHDFVSHYVLKHDFVSHYVLKR